MRALQTSDNVEPIPCLPLIPLSYFIRLTVKFQSQAFQECGYAPRLFVEWKHSIPTTDLARSPPPHIQ